MFTRNTYRLVLVLILLFTVVEGIAVLRTTTWPIEKWFGAW